MLATTVLAILVIVQIALYHFYRISGLLSGVLFASIFGGLSLNFIDNSSFPTELLNGVIFMIVFYLSLMKPNGEFFKKHILKYRNLIVPTLITMVISLSTAIYIGFDTHIALILVFAISIISLSTNSISIDFLKSNELEKSELSKIFFAKALPNNGLILVLFVSLLAIFDGGSTEILDIFLAILKVSLFVVISLGVSRYIYPRISQKIKSPNLIIVLLFGNALIQSLIAYSMGLHFIIGLFLSNLFIPEIFLKLKNLEPIREKVGNFNNYISIPLLGLAVGLNLDTAILFDYELFIPFAILTTVILVTQFISSAIFVRFLGLKSGERDFISFGSFAKAELNIIILLISMNFGLIDSDIFTSSIILISFLNLFAWDSLKSINLQKR